MRKKRERFWMLAGWLLLLSGCIHLLLDWLRYNASFNSAPFSLWVLLNGIYFGIPAGICFLMWWILRKRDKTRKDEIQ